MRHVLLARNWGQGSLFLLLLVPLTGCGNDRPVYNPPAPSPPAAPAAPVLPVETAPAADAPSDPLTSGSSTGQSSDPFLTSDPLGARAMPTQHSHWLRGHLRNAHLTVLLNSTRAGIYRGLVDKDITMRLRKGLNSVTFIYQPIAANSSAQMEVVESEHNPPIAPLVIFQSPPSSTDGKFQPLTQTFRFIAD